MCAGRRSVASMRVHNRKQDGDFCKLHEALPNMSVHMVGHLQTCGECKVTLDSFVAKYYPDATEKAEVDDFKQCVKTMRAHM